MKTNWHWKQFRPLFCPKNYHCKQPFLASENLEVASNITSHQHILTNLNKVSLYVNCEKYVWATIFFYLKIETRDHEQGRGGEGQTLPYTSDMGDHWELLSKECLKYTRILFAVVKQIHLCP